MTQTVLLAPRFSIGKFDREIFFFPFIQKATKQIPFVDGKFGFLFNEYEARIEWRIENLFCMTCMYLLNILTFGVQIIRKNC